MGHEDDEDDQELLRRIGASGGRAMSGLPWTSWAIIVGIATMAVVGLLGWPFEGMVGAVVTACLLTRLVVGDGRS